MNTDIQVRDFLQKNFGDAILKQSSFADEESYLVKADSLFEICRALLQETKLDVKYLADITSVDWLDHRMAADGRYEVVYNLYSLKNQYRFFLKVHLPEDDPTIDSLTSLWQGANWMEREVYDLMGIKFTGHPNLERILTAEDMEGHPLRRDYPLTYEIPQFSHNKDRPPEVID